MTVINYERIVSQKIREVHDFPKKGIAYKDITPLLACAHSSSTVIDAFEHQLSQSKVDAVVGIESRGFIFGMMLANRLNVPFVPIRKAGKLPHHTIAQQYDLEYGSATIEIHTDSIKEDWNVVIHDDLLATGGTANAAAKLITQLGGNVESYLFLLELTYLSGRKILEKNTETIFSLVKY